MAVMMNTLTRKSRFSLEVSKVSPTFTPRPNEHPAYTILVYEDPEPSSDERTEKLELENDQLRSKIAALERELMGRSPTKKSKSRNALEPSRTSNILGRESDIEMALSRMDQLKLTDNMFSPQNSTVGKKQKMMTTRKWDLAPEDDI